VIVFRVLAFPVLRVFFFFFFFTENFLLMKEGQTNHN